MTAENLAVVFAPTILRDRKDETDMKAAATALKRTTIATETLIKHAPALFELPDRLPKEFFPAMEALQALIDDEQSDSEDPTKISSTTSFADMAASIEHRPDTEAEYVLSQKYKSVVLKVTRPQSPLWGLSLQQSTAKSGFLLVTGIEDEGLKKSGLCTGDVILLINGESLEGTAFESSIQILSAVERGSSVTFGVARLIDATTRPVLFRVLSI